MKDYHKDFSFWSKSFLVNFLNSPLAAKGYMNEEKKDTPAMNFGRAYHLACEGKKVDVYDQKNRPDLKHSMSAMKNAAWLEELKKDHETIISFDELQVINDMIDQLKKNETYKKIAKFSPKQEEPFMTVWKGYKLKCKPDAILESRALIIDWKTIDDISERGIFMNMRKFHYDMQAAHYCEVLGNIKKVKHNFLFMFQEKKAPYDVLPVLVRYNSETYKRGLDKLRVCCERAEKAFTTGIWSGAASKFDNGILELE